MPMMAQAPKKSTAASKEAVVSEAEKGTGLAGETVITCDAEVEFNYEANTAVFSKNVKVASSDGVIEADRITLFLDIKTKKIKEVVAEGNVKITRGDNTSYSDKATYMETDKKVVLSGNPRIVFYQEGGVGEKFLGK
jgi:lipopolysaccharide assembly outer membrane protein LptD (OstA)